MIIYSATNINNNKIYIGQSQQSLEKRWKNHLRDYNRNDKNTHFYNAIRKYGTECWKVEVLEEVNNIELLNEAEMKWIEHYDTFNRDKGYNSTNGGENGFIFSDETKEKMRQAKLGKSLSEETKEKMKQSMLGKTHTEETKKKISDTKNNNPYIYSEEQKEKMRQSHLGKHLSEETKEKMSLSKKGKMPDNIDQIAGWNKGIPCSQEVINKISDTCKKLNRIPWNKDKKSNNTPWNKGIPMTEETKEKVSKSRKGIPAWNKGKPLSESHRLALCKPKRNNH